MQASTVPSHKVIIRPMLSDDLQQIVEVHLKSFSGFFLTFLGRDFLTLLYGNMQNDSEGVILVACRDGQIKGFVAGVTRQSGFYQHLIKKRRWTFALAALKALFRRPNIAPRLLRALKRPVEVQQASAEACLMSIAVRPESEGKGIGKQLVEAFCKELAGHGAAAVCLTTDRDNNDRVNRFYQGLGFRLSRVFVTPEGRPMNEYVMPLNKD
jgi:ribosomal protein S18 acetylase RimI-like enzyme